jgi:predicted negative regulator of RcsB-dependent stress response
MAERITKKELKEPDWFQVELARLMAFVQEYRKQVILGAAFVIVVFVVAAGWFLYDMNYERSADRLFMRAMQEAGTAQVPAKNSQTVKLLEELTAKYPRSDVAVMALYRLANIYYNLGDMDRAIKENRVLIERAPRGSELVSLAYGSLGYAYEAKGDYKQALASFESAQSSPAGWALAAVNERNIGRMQELLGQPAQAAASYAKALEKTKDPATQMLLKRKIAMLGGAGTGR